MKKPRTTIKQIAETKVSETLNLGGLRQMFPYNWAKKLKELEKSRFRSVIFPE